MIPELLRCQVYDHRILGRRRLFLTLLDFLFTVKGDTKGAIWLQWNIHESTQGSTRMWDWWANLASDYDNEANHLQSFPCWRSHKQPFAIDGLSSKNRWNSEFERYGCSFTPSFSRPSPLVTLRIFELGIPNLKINRTILTHPQDGISWYRRPTRSCSADSNVTMIEVYSARGILMESQDPTWPYGTASEHNVLHQYQLLNAKNIWMGHIQSGTPHYQSRIKASQPFTKSHVPSHPAWDCKGQSEKCEMAWGLCIISFSDIIVHGAGLYSSSALAYCVLVLRPMSAGHIKAGFPNGELAEYLCL